MTLAIDVSNFTGPISRPAAEALYAVGVRRAVVQAVRPDILIHREQVPNLRAAGIDIEAYVYVWFSAGEQWAADRVRWACDEMRQYGVRRMWLDCEQSDQDDPPFDYVHEMVTPTIDTCVATVYGVGMKPGIYTARWWWVPGASDSARWSALPLWNANYDGVQALGNPGYGGWERETMRQYAGSSTLAGVSNIDLDWFEDDYARGRADGIAAARAALEALR